MGSLDESQEPYPLDWKWLEARSKFSLALSPLKNVFLKEVKTLSHLATQLCLTLCDPTDCSTPGFPVHHQLPELTQTHVHQVGDTIQPSHALPSPSPSAFNLSQHQSLFWSVSFFTSGGQSIGALVSASVLPMNIQDWFSLGWTGLISLQPKGLSRVFSNTRVQKHQVFGAQLSLESTSHIHTWLLENP